MKTKLLLLAIFSICLFSDNGFTQGMYNKVIYKNDGGGIQASNFLATSDGNYILCGTNVGIDASIVKLDVNGTVLWHKEYVTTSTQQAFYNLYETSDGFVAVGSSTAFTDNKEKFLCVRLDANGEVIWSKTYDFEPNYEYCFSIQPTPDGGFIMVGNCESSPYMGLAAKINGNGDLLWAQTYSAAYFDVSLNTAKANADGSFIIVGSMVSNSLPFIDYTLIMKTNSVGVPVWAEEVSFPNTYYSNGCDVILKANEYMFTIISGDLILLKTDLNGTPTWTRKIYANTSGSGGGFLMHATPLSGLNELSDGGYIYLSNSYYEGSLIKLDQNLNPVFHRSLMFTSVNAAPTPDGGILAIGNGPVMGVSMGDIPSPHVGLYKTNELGETPNCSYDHWTDYDTILATIAPAPLTYGGTAVASDVSIIATTSSLLTSSECVTYYGSIEENERDLSFITPNPNSGIFSIQLNQEEQMSRFEVFDMQGKKIFDFTDLCAEDTHFDLGSAKPGLYHVKLHTSRGIRSQKMVVK